MKRALKLITKWFFRILLGIAGLILLLVLIFYLLRGRIIDKAISYVNDEQPGEVYLDNLQLRPFLNFPDVSLQLMEVMLYENKDRTDFDSIPIVRIDDIYVSVDLVKLIKGEYDVSNIRISGGEVNYIIGSDSVSNIERALGMRFNQAEEEVESETDSSVFTFNLESFQIRNLNLNYHDDPGETMVSLRLNGLESAVFYHPDTITASIMMHADVFSALFDEIVLDKPRSVSFSTSVKYDQVSERILLSRSMMDLNDAIFELEGDIQLAEQNVNLKFSAKNRGIELLNFLLSGVLNLDVIEQIGEGEIAFNGNVSGSYDDAIPLVELNFRAADMGFKIHSVNQSVTEIGFVGYASNGRAKDFSEAEVRLDDFHLKFPEGSLDATVQFTNLITPDLFLQLEGTADLSVLNEILTTEDVKNMKGKIDFKGLIDGVIDKRSGSFLDNAGSLALNMHDVSLDVPGYFIEKLSGELFIEEKSVGFRKLNVSIDSNDLQLDGQIDYLLPYLFGFSVEPSASLTVNSEKLYYQQFLGDTLVGQPLRDLGFRVDIRASGDEIEKLMNGTGIPAFSLAMQNLHAKVPGYADISDVKFFLTVNDTDLHLSKFRGNVGKSQLNFDLGVMNYGAYLDKDSTAEVSAKFEMSSRLLRAKDLLTINDEFTLLPASFVEEEMRNFKFKGKVETTVYELLNNSDLPNFKFLSELFETDLKYYPLPIRDFTIDIENRDSLIKVNRFDGSIGENNFNLKAEVVHLLDSTGQMGGTVLIQSDLLDIDEILNYQLLSETEEQLVEENDSAVSVSAGLHEIDFPDLVLNLDVKEFRFEGNEFFGINGQFRLKPYSIIYLDRFAFQTATGGSVVLDGQFNVSDSAMYTLSASLEIDTLNISDFDVQVAIEDSLYSLEENFKGILTADALAEFFINPDLSIDLDTSTVIFNFDLTDARIVKFAPLHAIARFTGKSDLDNVEGVIRNSKSITLSDGSVTIPLMSIESTIGLILIEGEQGLGGDMLYLVRVPTSLIRGAAWNVVTNQQRKDPDEEQEIQTMETQKFARVTVIGKDENIEVKLGDKRDKY